MNDENGKVKIEKGVPMPNSCRGASKYPWKEMEVGDSFLISAKSVACVNRENKDGKRFVSRQETSTHRRVWRVA